MQKIISTHILSFSFFLLFGQTKYQQDFSFYWQTVKDNFAYFHKQHINWDKVKTIYQPVVDTIKSDEVFLHFLETVNNELYNGHVFLNRNASSSNRPVPTGADLKVSWINNTFVITEVREGFNAGESGLKPGMVVVKYNDMLITEATQKFLPKSASSIDRAMYEYAANMLLAGTHDAKRKITVITGNKERNFFPDVTPNKTENQYKAVLEAKELTNHIGYIKINNSLGDMDLIKEFDLALDNLMMTKSLIIDLRETPSGGTTSIAKAIMGRFVDKEQPYQKHIYTSEENETGIRRSALELVSPRRKIYRKKLIILVGYWTGSMGEGIAIGFDAMKRAKIVGTKMAGLLGEIYSFETPETKIPFSFPCVQLQHINGQPREDFVPGIFVKDQKQTLKIATDLLTNTNNKEYKY